VAAGAVEPDTTSTRGSAVHKDPRDLSEALARGRREPLVPGFMAGALCRAGARSTATLARRRDRAGAVSTVHALLRAVTRAMATPVRRRARGGVTAPAPCQSCMRIVHALLRAVTRVMATPVRRRAFVLLAARTRTRHPALGTHVNERLPGTYACASGAMLASARPARPS
jgi:hypothetical protein